MYIYTYIIKHTHRVYKVQSISEGHTCLYSSYNFFHLKLVTLS